ncbi:uncharacterized protein LOC142351746 [Convolutriloba macropyga]|uniref:uncharacterized protein LOC142351746 n=1 Tax=Convolutriloba macropyga TaxID=536237 RepID=UPI003F51CC5B
MEIQNQTTVRQTTPQVIYQPSGNPRWLPQLKLTEFSGNSLERPEWSELFDVILHKKWPSDTYKMQYLKISLTGQAYYQAWDVLCKKCGRPRAFVESQLKKINPHSPVKHDDSSSIVRFPNAVTNTVNVLTRLRFQHDLDLEGVLNSTARKLFPQLKAQWLRHLHDH